MAASIRRVVTGHDDNGKARVESDQVVEMAEMRPKTSNRVLWTTEGFPVDNNGHEDTSGGASGLTLANGTVFRVVEFGPGNTQRVHRTDSIDYAVVMAGEIDMEIEDSVVHLKAGDVLVQRGTVHNWVNNGSAPCRIAFILIDAKPVSAGGKLLSATG